MNRLEPMVVCVWTIVAIGAPIGVNAQQAPQPPQATEQTAAQPPVAPTIPIPLGVDGQIAPWLQVRGEFRTRIEGSSGGGFTDGNDDAYWMDRFRLSATIRPSAGMAFVVQAHDARAFNKTAGGQAAPFRDTLDLRVAYGEFGSSTVVRIGRQELAFGEQRLVGHLGWANTARSFDGARVTLKRPGIQVDGFAASIVTIQPDGFDKSGGGNALYGAYASLTSVVPKQVVEPYFLWRRARDVSAELGGPAPLHQATTGLRMAGPLTRGFDYSGEVAAQTGSVGADDIRAWALHAVVGRTFASVKALPRAFVEYNYASGDANGVDGRRGTFDQLYPTGHDKLGLGDQVGWRNIRHLRTGVEAKPSARLQVNGSYHSWWLASTTDGLYNSAGALVARSATGTAGRYVGQELDLQAAYTYSPQLQIGTGLAHVFPGEFLRNATPGGSYTYSYVMLTYVFVGDKPAIGWRHAR